jgi:hypothetical protein
LTTEALALAPVEALLLLGSAKDTLAEPVDLLNIAQGPGDLLDLATYTL